MAKYVNVLYTVPYTVLAPGDKTFLLGTYISEDLLKAAFSDPSHPAQSAAPLQYGCPPKLLK